MLLLEAIPPAASWTPLYPLEPCPSVFGRCGGNPDRSLHAERTTLRAGQRVRKELCCRVVVVGQPVAGHPGLYRVDTVVEKPTPTAAEQQLTATGVRAGHYLAFFGMRTAAEMVLAHPIPNDLEAVKLLGGAPAVLDLYIVA